MKNQRKFRKLMKRLISGVSALALSVGLLASIPASADDSTVGYKYTLFAYSSEDDAISSSAANFCVNGNIATNGTISAGQNFNVNGEKKEHANEAMPDLSKAINEKFFAENVDVKADNYKNEDVNINVVSPLDVKGKAELNGNIKLAAGVKAMGDIVLSGGVLNNDNTVLFSEKGNIVINSENVSLTGLVYAPKGNIVIESKSLNLNSVVMIANKITLNSSNININNSASMAKFVQESIDKNGGSNGNDEPEPEADPAIYAYGEYNEITKSVDIEWYSNVTGEFAVLESLNGTDYTVVSKVSDDTKYSIKVASDFIKKFYKVTIIKDGKTIESIPFAVTKETGKYTTELLDTDKDGLADLYEEMLGTDKTLPDTDKDGLTDYEEVYITNTDPTKYDSVTEGVSDADADNDKDGLTNKKEIEIKTDPNSDDTDGDNLKDGDELSKYNTDLLKPDTDGDGINDGDEVLLKLDPTKTVTDGVKDSEHYFEQEIPADSKVFSEINTEDSPYTLSMKINCTGYAESNVTASESSYHSAIESEMTVGKIADISLNETCKSKEIVLYYKINEMKDENAPKRLMKSSLSDSVSESIKKYGIFTFDSEHNTVVPVNTLYDIANGIVYANVNHAGTYYIGNMQKWIESVNSIRKDSFVANQEIIDKADVVFSVNISNGSDAEKCLKDIKANIIYNSEQLFKNSKDIRIAVLGYSDQIDSTPFCKHTRLSKDKSEWATNIEEVTELLGQLSIDKGSEVGLWELALQDIARPMLGTGEPYSFREDADKYAFVYSNSQRSYSLSNSFNRVELNRVCTMKPICDRLVSSGIKTSLLFDTYVASSLLQNNITRRTNGLFTTYASNDNKPSTVVYDLINKTAKKTSVATSNPTTDNTVFLSSLTLKPIKLSCPLYVNGRNDTDEDGMTDWEETVNSVLSSDEDIYEYTPVSLEEAMKSINADEDNILYRYIKENDESNFESYIKMPFLFLKSDPTKIDTDDDGYFDKNDPRPNESDIIITKLKNDYIRIDHSKESGNRWDISYGGCQGWFGDVEDYPDKEIVSKQGCGLIAMCDTILYLAKTNEKYRTELTNRVRDINANLSFDEYFDIVKRFNDRYARMDMDDPFELKIFGWTKKIDFGTNTNDRHMGDILTSYFSNYDIKLEASWCYTENNIYADGHWFEKNTRDRRIKEMISNDIPAIISIGPGIGDPLILYKKEKVEPGMSASYVRSATTKGHYLTVTAIIEDKVKQEKGEFDSVMYEVSSWGNKYYISQEDLRDHVHLSSSITTNVVYIKEK